MTKSSQQSYLFILTASLLFFLLQTGHLLSQVATPASPADYIFKKLTVEDGLSNNIVSAVLEDHYGYIWIGTNRGLNRYDGYRIRSFIHDPNDSLSIADGSVTSLAADHSGNLWIGTEKGLMRFDYASEQFTLYPQSLPQKNTIRSLFVDDNNTLWAGNELGVYTFDRSSGKFLLKHTADKGIAVNHITKDIFNNYYFGTWEKGVLMKNANYKTYILRDLAAITQTDNRNFNIVAAIHIDHYGTVWIGTVEGLFATRISTDISSSIPRFFDFREERGTINNLSNNHIHAINEDSKGNLWIGTEYGLNIYNPQTNELKNILNVHNDPGSLSNNLVTTIYRDSNGIMWVGTYQGGLNIYYPDYNRFHDHFPEVNNSEIQMQRYIKSIASDTDGNIWIGSDYGLLKTSFENKDIRYYTHEPGNPASLNKGGVSAIHIDRQQRMWIGTWGGGVHEFDPVTETFRRLPWKESVRDNPLYQGDINIRAIHEDREGYLWFGSTRGYLDKYDPDTGLFEHFFLTHPDTEINAEVIYITNDTEDNVWIGTLAGGLYQYERKSGRITQYLSEGYRGDQAIGLLSSNDAYCIHFSGEQTAWVGTNNGLDFINFKTGEKKQYTASDGLASNLIYNIQEDFTGNLWLSTPKGISKFNVSRNIFINYDASDGVRVNAECGHANAKGWIFFGGVNGITAFNPSDFRENEHIPPIVFTEFKIHNQAVEPGTDAVLPKHINELEAITLTHNQNVFSVEFAALNYVDPAKNKYMYQLEGFDKEWIYAGTSREARYTNLDPGTYRFLVRGSNNDGLWNEEARSLEITVLPPWWNTFWFKLIILISVLASIAFWITFRTYRLKQYQVVLKQRVRERTLEIEEQKQMLQEQAQKLHMADQMKINFFTNISHEFRTPLTLILNPLEKLWTELSHKQEYALPFTVIKRNTLRLVSLINQFLDISKIEAGALRLSVGKGDIIKYIMEIATTYKMATEQKNIRYTIRLPQQRHMCYFDGDKIEKILYNLLSNALKHTPPGGRIDVSASFAAIEGEGFDPANQNDDNKEIPGHLIIRVKDTGKGIPKGKIDRVFERFYRADEDLGHIAGGTGIGLSLTKDLVDLYRGKIEVKSEVDAGTEFSILLPVEKALFHEDEIVCFPSGHDEVKSALVSLEEAYPEQENTEEDPPDKTSKQTAISLLIVEDNRDVRQYLAWILKEKYNVLLAKDGEEGVAKAKEHLPQLIVSDVMMPKMDGYSLCEKVKNNMLTCHIPVILLTAKATAKERLEGIELGADAYISKPFDINLLKATIVQLTGTREKLKQVFRREAMLQPKEIALECPDEKLLQRICRVLDEKLSDPDFGVEQLGREVGLSRTHLYRKIKELTDQTAIEFIRNTRLQCAAQMLKQNKLYVSEIAYMCGFKELSYFRKIFREIYGVPPQEYATSDKADATSAVAMDYCRPIVQGHDRTCS